MVDLDDEYDDEPGPEPGREQRWSPNKQREWERGTGVDDRGNYNDGGREPLGETTEPSSLYRQDGAPDGLHDDGVHYDRQPSEPSQVRCLVVLSFYRTVVPSNRRSVQTSRRAHAQTPSVTLHAARVDRRHDRDQLAHAGAPSS